MSIATADIRASVEFYEGLGFSQAQTGDAWSHPYGVLTDGRVYLGLHQRRSPSPALTFVHAEIAEYATTLESRGIHLDVRKTGEDVFNEIGFRDPTGQSVSVLEARTYSPAPRRSRQDSLCGYFTEFSIPAADFEAAQAFWEPLGFVATEEPDAPYERLPLTSDHLDIAFHRPPTFSRPLLVFRAPDMRSRLAQLRELGVSVSAQLPGGLDSAANGLIETPEATALLLLEGED